MSGISSSTGLVSGLPTAELISQLMAVEARPVTLLQQRVGAVQAERTAFADLSSRLLSLKSAIANFDQRSFFDVFRANSSDTNVLTATAGAKATLGTFGFQVHSLVASHELISRGFADADTTPLGAGLLTLESGQGLLNPPTDLESLNGGAGVRRGTIRITDRAGVSADLNLTATLTVQDVIDAINAETTINVRASVQGDSIILEDLNATATGSLTVSDLTGGQMARDLGIAGTSTTGRIVGTDIVNLVDTTLLSALNDGMGFGRAPSGSDLIVQRDDGARYEISLSGTIDANTRLEVLNGGNSARLGVIRITDRLGQSVDVDLSAIDSGAPGATPTLGDVVTAIEQQTAAAGLDLDVTYFNSSRKHALQIVDNAVVPEVVAGAEEAAPALKIEDVSGFGARDLGIATESTEGSIVGTGIHRVDTVGDVMRAIEFAYDATTGQYNAGGILAGFSANGNGIVLSSVGVPRGFDVLAADGSTAAQDLGLLGRYEGGVAPAGAGGSLIAGLNSVLTRTLNGGTGLGTGIIRIIDGAGRSADVDLTGIETVQGILDTINAAGLEVQARINTAGNGIAIDDTSNVAGSSLVVQDVSGTLAQDMGLAGSFAEGRAEGGNLQRQYIAEQTLLAELNGGRGVRTGQIRMTDSNGVIHTVTIADNQKTVGDVIQLINAAGGTLQASINATGDGILVTDSAGGTEALTITDQDGFAARDLRIAGEAAAGETSIDGSFEFRIQIEADDTLQDVVNKIDSAGGDFSAAVLNDGSSTAPFRLVVNSQISGTKGQLIFDPGQTGLSMSTLAQARDAVVFFGGADSTPGAPGLVLRSSSNTLDDVLEGVSIDLVGTSDKPVELSISQDVDAIVEDLNAFVTSYNDVIDRIGELTSFDSETFERGILFGDSTVTQIENRLFRSVTRPFENTSNNLSRLAGVGITLAAGGRLELDEERFREVYQEDPDSVEQLFTAEETGFGAVFDEVLDDLTRGVDGLIANKDSALEGQEDILNDRIDNFQVLLDAKRTRLERQFASLEGALALLQGQQSALTQLQSLAFA
ncbi:MAG: flagellar filament capping protein FliD [Phycisphaerae bacterium]